MRVSEIFAMGGDYGPGCTRAYGYPCPEGYYPDYGRVNYLYQEGYFYGYGYPYSRGMQGIGG